MSSLPDRCDRDARIGLTFTVFVNCSQAATFIGLVARHGSSHHTFFSTLDHSSCASLALSKLPELFLLQLRVLGLLTIFVVLEMLSLLLQIVVFLLLVLLYLSLHLFLTFELLGEHFLHFFALVLSVQLLFVENHFPAALRSLKLALHVAVALELGRHLAGSSVAVTARIVRLVAHEGRLREPSATPVRALSVQKTTLRNLL